MCVQVYAYRTNTGEVTVKVKGLTLNSATSQLLNFDSMKECVQQFVQERTTKVIDVAMNRITRDKDHIVYTEAKSKRFRVVYDKRVVKDDYTTIPYGY